MLPVTPRRAQGWVLLPRRYEGLMVLDVPHVKGTIQFGNGLGGGIQDADAGDV